MSVAWILLCLLLTAAWLLFQLRNVFSTGSGGIGAVSTGFISVLVLAIPLAPPIGLILAWLITHRR